MNLSAYVLTVLAVAALACPASAQRSCEDAVQHRIERVFDGEYRSQNFDSALEKLQTAKDVCEETAFSKQTRARLYLAIGTIYAAMGKRDTAQRFFEAALKDDSNIRNSVNNFRGRFTMEASGYTDTMQVHVLSPSVALDLEHITDGWGLGGSFLVDVVASASPSWRAKRYVPAIYGHKQFGVVDLALAGSLAREPEYLSGAVGLNVRLDLLQKAITPSLGYQYSHDVRHRAEVPWSLFSRPVERHTISARLGLLLSSTTVGSGLLTIVAENGDQSRLYLIQKRQGVNTVIKREGLPIYRELLGPVPEQLPLSRQRFRFKISVAHRLVSATLRLNALGYYDSWGVLATTTDGRLMYDVTKALKLWPYLRLHYQGSASFYTPGYAAQASKPKDSNSPLVPPSFRSADRELAQMLAITAGGGTRYDFGEERMYSMLFNGDFVSTLFFDHPVSYSGQGALKRRFGFLGALTFEAGFE